jgi:hypothetical protein
MEPESTEQEIARLTESFQTSRNQVIEKKRLLNIQEQIFYKAKREYDKEVKIYTSLDRELALTIARTKVVVKPVKTYDLAKRTMAKAIKAIESLPKELREKILSDMKDNLF